MSFHVDLARFEASSGSEREALVAHLVSCAECRARIAEGDPTQLFGLLAARPMPRPVLDEVSREVTRSLPLAKPSWIEAVQLRGASRVVAAAAVIAVALVTGSVVLRNGGKPAVAPSEIAVAPAAGVSTVESLRPARVVDLTVGETQIVMIFDPEMKL